MKAMFRHKLLVLVCGLSIFVVGCASLQEVGKKLWGSSTQALEKKRGSGRIAKFRCSLDECFDEVLNILKQDEAIIFKQDRDASYIVAINFEDVIATTEVGIFFETSHPHIATVEITSLNHRLQEQEAAYIFSELEKKFRKIGN